MVWLMFADHDSLACVINFDLIQSFARLQSNLNTTCALANPSEVILVQLGINYVLDAGQALHLI